jgi:carbamoyl-phosphate synthase large subunit
LQVTEKLNMLVLGVGGNVGQGILKALAMSQFHARVIGACINASAMGLYVVDRAYISPPADHPDFMDWLIKTCSVEHIHAVFSGVEPVIRVLSKKQREIREKTGAVCIVSDPFQLSVGDDKLVTCQWLEQHGFQFPQYAASKDKEAIQKLAENCGFPLIAKYRFGRGSREMIQIKDENVLESVSMLDDYVIQECIGDPDSEYTAGCFCDREGRTRGVIVMRRQLNSGTTCWAEVGAFPDIRAEVTRIADKLKPRGPCNVQLRMSSKGPVCFEINVRFSGTTPMRAYYGFNEVEAAIRHFVLNEPLVDFPIIREGVVVRYWNELYLSPEAAHTMEREGLLHEPLQFGSFFENFGRKK